MASVWDYVDLFRTIITFSNRISSPVGKICTVSYLLIFIYLSVASIIYIFLDNNIGFTPIQTYNQNFKTDSNLYYKKINLIISIQIFSSNESVLTHENAIKTFEKYFEPQVSSIQSKNYYYEKNSLNKFKCGSNGNILKFCVNYKFEVLNDFIFISFNEKSLVSEDDFNFFQILFS